MFEVRRDRKFFKMALQEKDAQIRRLEAESGPYKETYATNSLKQDLQNLLYSIFKKGTQTSFWMDLGQLRFSKKELEDISSTSQNEIKK